MANRMLAALEPLLGNWEAVISEARFLARPDETIRGRAEIATALDGAVIVMRAEFEDKRVPVGQWVIGADDDHHTYTALYHDSREVSRLCQLSFVDGVLEVWRFAPGFSQRFSARVGDGRIEGEWQYSSDGVSWHRDFRVTYHKV